MCPSKRILNRSANGILTFCDNSKLFQLVYNNLCFELYEWELQVFKDYLDKLDVHYWEKQLRCAVHQKKIPISVGTKHFIILLDRNELFELRQLVSKDNGFTHILDATSMGHIYSKN